MNEWELLGLEPVNDVKSIKRAYARKIKTIDPSEQAAEFQEIREAYEYLVDYGIYYVDDDDQVVNDDKDETYDEGILDEKCLQEQDVEIVKDIEFVKDVLSEHQGAPEQIRSFSFEGQPFQQKELAIDEFQVNERQATELHEIEVQSTGTEIQTVDSVDEYFDPDEIVDDFIQELRDLYNEEKEINLNEWVSILDREELQFLEVNDILRFDTFGFFLSKIETSCEANDSLSDMLAKLPKGIDKVIKHYAVYFDWENTDLLLARHFGHEQMQLLSGFYLKPVAPVEEVAAKNESSGFGTFFIWFAIFLAIKFILYFFE